MNGTDKRKSETNVQWEMELTYQGIEINAVGNGTDNEERKQNEKWN